MAYTAWSVRAMEGECRAGKQLGVIGEAQKDVFDRMLRGSILSCLI